MILSAAPAWKLGEDLKKYIYKFFHDYENHFIEVITFSCHAEIGR